MSKGNDEKFMKEILLSDEGIPSYFWLSRKCSVLGEDEQEWRGAEPSRTGLYDPRSYGRTY